jgi:hypothetical protein
VYAVASSIFSETDCGFLWIVAVACVNVVH